MKRNVFVWLKRLFLSVYWFFERMLYGISDYGRQIIRRKKRIYATDITKLLEFKDKSPLDQISAPPWNIRISGTCLILGKYVTTQIYHAARSNRWTEIYGFVLGKRFGDLFIGVTFVEITNILRSVSAALPDFEHVQELKEEISSRYPDLQIVSIIHSHPNGLLRPSKADIICFLRDDFPNVIVSPLRLYHGSPINRMAAFYHTAGIVRKIKLLETDKKETEITDINFEDIKPSKAEILKAKELSSEIDFGVFKMRMTFNPSVTVKHVCERLSKEFGNKIKFVLLCNDGNWIFDPGLNIIDFFMKDGDQLVFPELFEEVKNG